MRKLTQTSTFKRVLAAVCTVGLCVTLAACGSGDSGSSSKKSGDDSSQSSDSSALKNMKKIAGITATGTLGEKPKVSFKAPKTVDNNSYAVLQEGNGATMLMATVCARRASPSASRTAPSLRAAGRRTHPIAPWCWKRAR